MNLIPFIRLHLALCQELPCRCLTVGGGGYVMSSDGACRPGLCLFPDGRLYRYAGGCWQRVWPSSAYVRKWLRRYRRQNRTELFCLRRASALSGLLFAEELNARLLKLKGTCPGSFFAPHPVSSLYMTWLVALAGHLAGRPGALRSVSLDCYGGVAMRVALSHGHALLHFDADGDRPAAEDRDVPFDADAGRYLRLFLSVSRGWREQFARFGRAQEKVLRRRAAL